MIDIVLGLQFGDEGKGKAASFLAKSGRYQTAIKANGGPNAGHTIVTDCGKTFKFSQLPGSSLYTEFVYIGAGAVVNIKKLKEEVVQLSEFNPNYSGVFIHPNTHIIQDKHIEKDIELEKQYNIGTTKQGIGPCYADAALRVGTIASKLSKKISKDLAKLKIYITYFCLSGNSLIEASQGVMLDPFYGNYPYVTSSSCHPGYLLASINTPISSLGRVYGVIKPYVTYVGGDKSFLDLPKKNGDCIREIGKEYGVVTGRPRRIGELNLHLLGDVIEIYGVTDLFINKFDTWLKYQELISNECVYTESHKFELKEQLLNTNIRNNINSIYWGTGPKTSEYEL